METATRRKKLRALAAQVPEARGRTGLLISEVLDPHFQAEDDVLERTRALTAADHAAQQANVSMLHAARESQVGTAAHRIKWSLEFEHLEYEARVASAALKQAWTEHERAVTTYHVLQRELLDDPVYL